MKKTLLTIVALLCIVGSEAKGKDVVWEKPTSENGNVYGDGFFNIAMDVNRVEMKETETTVSVTVNWRNDYDSFKFQFASGTYLLAEGKKYALVSADGIELEDGPIHADAISYVNDRDKNQAGIEIHSGRNRIVRRMFESLGYRVTKLDRVYFAGLTKKNLPRGRWRYLTQEEVNFLKQGSFE